MRRLALAALAVALAMPVPARAESGKVGWPCGFTSIADRTQPPSSGTQVGEITGGPLSIVDSTDPSILHSGRLTCSIHVGWDNVTHASPSEVAVTGPETPGVVAVADVVRYHAARTDPVYLCTAVTTDEGTWYYDIDNTDPTGSGDHWSTDPWTAECGAAISASCCEGDPVDELADLIVCPVLAVAATVTTGVPGVVELVPQAGEFFQGADVYVAGILVWDCPPQYD